MLDTFLDKSLFSVKQTDKQYMENIVRNSVLNLIVDRDESFLQSARKRNTSIIVNNRDEGVEIFNYDGRKYISIPTGLKKEFEGKTEDEVEEFMDSLLKVATEPKVNSDEYNSEEQEAKLINMMNSYKDITGQDSGFSKYTSDEDGNIVNKYISYKSIGSDEEKKKTEEDIKEGEDGQEGSCDVSNKGFENEAGTRKNQEVKLTMSGDYEDREYQFQDTELNIGSSIPKDLKSNAFFSQSSQITESRAIQLENLANQIVKSFKGRVSKNKTFTQTKRISTRDVVLDVSDKIYKNKKGNDGKHLSMNLIIDMSGSMSGEPVKNAIEMIYIFNCVALKGKLTGNVIWSESSSSCISNFPMPKEMIKRMSRTGGGEGLGRNFKKYEKQIMEVDTNICMTDGCLTDDPIVKEFYKNNKCEIIGVYVNKSAKDLTEYTGSLNRWFTKSLVRNTTEELCERIIQFGLSKKGKK